MHLDHDDTKSYMLVRMSLPHFPIAMGVIRACESGVYEDLLYKQIENRQIKIKNQIDECPFAQRQYFFNVIVSYKVEVLDIIG